VSSVKYELGFYIPEDDILHRFIVSKVQARRTTVHLSAHK
jgi:hypothetical protein